MRLSNEWFTALSEDETGHLVTVSGRDELMEFARLSFYHVLMLLVAVAYFDVEQPFKAFG